MDMAYSFNQFLAVQVGERGQIYTSDDLDLWLPRASGATNYLRGVTFFGSRVVVVGENGCVLYADSVDAFTNGVLLDGPTTNWLEAVAASDTLIVAVGDNGAVYTSANGIYWRKQSSPTNAWLYGVAYGNGVFAIGGEGGYIATSYNGSAWTKRTSGTIAQINRMTYSPMEWRFTAVADNGVTVFSTNNGVTWYPDLSGATNDLYNTAPSTGPGNRSRVQVGEHEVQLWNNFSWTNQLAATSGPPDWTYYANIGRQDFYLITGQSGMMAEGYRTNFNSYYWMPSAQSVRNWLWDVTCQDHLYAAVGDFATVMTSGNGVNWQLELVPPSVTNAIFFGVGGSSNLLVAAGSAGSLIISPNVVSSVLVTNFIGTDLVVTSTTNSSFGVIWLPVPRLTTNDLQGVGYYDGVYVVTGDKGVVLASNNGTNWTQRLAPTNCLFTSVAGWPGGWVAVGDDGALITSPNGLDWTLHAPFTTNWLYRVRYLNGNLIIAGQNGALYTSPDAWTWTARNSGTTKWLTDAAFIDDTYFVSGYFGTVLTSTNLTNWFNVGAITKKSLYGLASDSRQLIAAGVEGAILRCQVLPDLTPVRILQFSKLVSTNYLSTNSVAQNVYLFGGRPDQRFTLDHVQDMPAGPWITGPLLEILDTSGTLYYLEYITNAPVQEFYRATIPETE